MNLQTLNVTLLQMLQMVAFVFLGWLLGRTGKLGDISKGLSTLQIDVFMPMMIVSSLSQNFTRANALDKGKYFLVSVPLLFAVILVANGLARLLGKDSYRKSMFTFAFAFTNFGYLGYPVIRAVFGEETLADFILFAVPFTIALYTYGASLFEKQQKMPLYKKLIKPVTVAVVLGVGIGLSGLHLPAAAVSLLDMGGNCVGANAMLLTGIVLSKCDIPQMLRRPVFYLTAAIKLIAIPVCVLLALYAVGVRGNALLCGVTVTAMPVGMNIIVFSEANGIDSTEAAGHCVMASMFSVLTIPLIFAVLTAVM